MKADILGLYVGNQLSPRADAWTGSVGNSPLQPTSDDFYSVNGTDLTKYALGDIIKQREVGFAKLDNVGKGYQLVYRSENSWGDPRATVTTVIIPANSTGEHLLSYQIYEDAAWLDCAPSYASLSSVPNYIQTAINNGWVVNTPDYEGFNSSFAAGVLSGKMTLDSLRAVKNAENLTGLKNPKIAMTGYSGGSIATGHAAELQKSYAPDLEIVVASVGGYVVSLLGTLEAVNKSPYVGFVAAGLLGLASEYTGLWDIIYEQLSPDKYDKVFQVLKQCTEADILGFLGQDVFSYFKNGTTILQNEVVGQILSNNSLGQVAPSIPMHIYQGGKDPIAPVQDVTRVANFYCQNGGNVFYQIYPDLDHTTVGGTKDPDSLKVVQAAFDGHPISGCTFQDGNVTTGSNNNTQSANGTSTGVSTSASATGGSSGSSNISSSATPSLSSSTSPSGAASSDVTGNGSGEATVTTVVTAYTTYCPSPTTFAENGKTYTVTGATTLTITDCPCTRTSVIASASTPSSSSGSGAVSGSSSSPATANNAILFGPAVAVAALGFAALMI